MLKKMSKYSYNLTLPYNTAREVLEWFEIMESNNKLAFALVELVCESLKSGKPVKATGYLNGAPAEVQPSPCRLEADQESLFDSLYNWQDSNSAIFKEENDVKKEKKRMLSV